MSSTGNDCGTDNALSGSRPASAQSGQGSGASPGNAMKPPAVLCDFDDTTAVENVAELLLEHFSEDSAWRQLRQQSRDKTISLREYQERAFRNTNASREAMKSRVAAKATLRPYFKELWHYCRGQRIPLAIVTVGLDFYVEALLEREGLGEVPRYTVRTNFTPDGITYEYPYPWDGSGASSMEVCRQWGTCKCSIVSKYKRLGHSILYVGDGRSDFCPASISDHVFARSHLAGLCRDNKVLYTEFNDFQDVIRHVEGLVAEGAAVRRGSGDSA